MNEEPSAPPEATPPKRWRVVLARMSLALGLASCLTSLVGNSFCIAAFVTGDYRYTRAEYGRLWFVGLIMWAIALTCGMLTILLGSLARRSLPRSDRLTSGVRLAKAGIVLGYFGVAITLLSALILPILDPREKNPRLISCQNNLKEIGICLKMYAGENQDTFPDKLSAIYPEITDDVQFYVCPQSGNKPGDPARIDEWSDYTLVPGLHPTGTPADADVLVCYDNEYRHTPPGRHELYLDGHVELRLLGQPSRSAPAK